MAATVVRLATFLALSLSSVFFVWSFYTPRLESWGRHLLLVAFLLATADLGHMAAAVGGFPAVTPGVWVSFFVWMVSGVFLVSLSRGGFSTVGGFITPILTMIWLGGQFLDPTVDGHLPYALSGGWLVLHVALATGAYVAFMLAAAWALMYIEKERELRQKTPRVFYYRLPALMDSDVWSRRLVVIGLVLLTLAMATGVLWSKMVLDTYWGWTSKETWSVVTWGIYAGYLCARRLGVSGHRAAWLTILAFFLVVVNFFGLSFFHHGWHNYRG